MLGQTISHYRIVEKIGEGGMGQVFAAEDLELHRRVALKFLPPEFAADPSVLERFRREAQAAAALDHPNIVTVHDVGEYEGLPYIVMALAAGDPLSRLIERGALSAQRSVEIARGICSALAAAHAASVVHRDIKPDNIVIAPDGRPLVLDFGLAKVHGASKLTREESTVGTVAYMAPEQARGTEVDSRADIFSLGVVLYEMVTGRQPFQGQHRVAVLYAIANEEPHPMRRYAADAPAELERIVRKALAKKPEDRYQTAGDMLVDLNAVSSDAARPIATRRRRWVPAAVAVGALVLAAAAWYFLPHRNSAGVPRDRKSIAVLPFANMSADPENEYFSEGITDDIIAQLSKIADLRVVSRTSVMRYKGTDESLRDIGRELGVATILEGSVRREGARVRIVGQLIDARTDEHLWTNTYDRDLKEIFEIQSDVAQRIAKALEVVLTPEESARIASVPTEDMTAYDYYLRGRESYYRYRKQDNENAIVFFKKALEHDPGYALAYAGLGDAYGQRVLAYRFAQEWIDSSLAASERAIALDPDLSEGYKALAVGYFTLGWKRKALEATLKAVELDPNYTAAIGNVGWAYLRMGRPDQALPWYREAMAKETRSNAIERLGMAGVYLSVGDYETARRWINDALDAQPDLFEAKMFMAMSYGWEQRLEEARAMAKALVDEYPNEPRSYLVRGWIEVDAGDVAAAKPYFQEAVERAPAQSEDRWYAEVNLGCSLEALGDRERAGPFLARSEAYMESKIDAGDENSDLRVGMACISALAGREDEALDWLAQAFATGAVDYGSVQRNPFLASLRGKPRFQQMIADVRARTEDLRDRVHELEPVP